MIFVDSIKSFIGVVRFECDEKSLLNVDILKEPSKGLCSRKNLITEITREWLELYFAKNQPSWYPPIKIEGSDFRRKVLLECMNVGFSKTLSYSELAAKVGNPGAARAVGSVMKKNSCPIIVPCHRVVAKSSIGGYFYGIEMKKRLLEFEGAYR